MLIVAVMAAAGLLWMAFPAVYPKVIQEDGLVEWMTFWAFMAAAALAIVAFRQRQPDDHVMRHLYLLAFAVGAFAVAMEEISWGQRLIGYQPPETFLAENFQQEFNLHNLAGTDTRKALLLSLLISFGVLFPVLGRVPPLAGWLQRWSVPVPGLGLMPGFALLAAVYLIYPIESTGEWIELGAGLGFTCAALAYPRVLSPSARWAFAGLPLVLGVITPFFFMPGPDPERVALAVKEAEALAEEVGKRRLRSRCGVHKRVYTFVEEYGSGDLSKGAWAQLEPVDETEALRHQYFLDPWNMPYWIRHTCSGGRATAIFVYSFGPNRRRDSGPTQIVADDVGAYAR